MRLPPITALGTISALRRSFPRPAGTPTTVPVAAGVAGLLLGLGVRLLITADLGVAPLDIALVAISDLTGIGLGFVAVVIQAGLLTLAWRLGRPPVMATWIFVVTGGITLQLTGGVAPVDGMLALRAGLWAAGFGIVVIGLGLVVAGTHAGGSFELLSRAAGDRGLSPVHVRTAMEVSVVVLGVGLGGPAGLGSAVFAVAVGPSSAVATRHWATTLDRWALAASTASPPSP